MNKPIHNPSSWGRLPPGRSAAQSEADAGAPTVIQTQMMRSKEEYLANEARDIGRRINDQQHELFVVCDPAEAMVQQFQHISPDFIALHDVGTDASVRLLAGLANATRGKLQQLVIRRQGYGMALATIEFAELPSAAGQSLRVYSTHVDADTQQRMLLARALLAHSRLGVVMLGDLPPHSVQAAVESLRDGIAAGPWPNRHLLLVPLGSASAVAALGAPMASLGGVGLRTTPHAASPSQAWSFISNAWNRLRAGLPPEPTSMAPAPGPAPVAMPPAMPASRPLSAPPSDTSFANTAHTPLQMQPMPAPGGESATPEATPWERYVRECVQIKGMVSCCVFDVATQRSLAHAGARPGPASLASQGASIIAAMNDAGRKLGLGAGQPDAVVTLAGHMLLLHSIPGQPGLALHAVLDRSAANLAQVKVQLHRLDPLLESAARG